LLRALPYIEDALPALFFPGTQTGQLPEHDRLLLAMAKVDADTRAQVERIVKAKDVPLTPLYGSLVGSAAPLDKDDEAREKLLAQVADDFVKVRADLQRLAQLQTQGPSSAVLAEWISAHDGPHAAELEHLVEASLTGGFRTRRVGKNHYDALKGDSTR
jgi:hypothetical protein